MHQQKYFTSNFFINEIFFVEKFPNYGKLQYYQSKVCTGTVSLYYVYVSTPHVSKKKKKISARSRSSLDVNYVESYFHYCRQ